MLARPATTARVLFARNWHKRISVLTVMQQADNEIGFGYGRTLLEAMVSDDPDVAATWTSVSDP